jgi:hypothetical protein
VDHAIAAYLADGTLPARKPGRTSDLKCDPVPVPEPEVAALQRTAPQQAAKQELRRELQQLIGIR